MKGRFIRFWDEYAIRLRNALLLVGVILCCTVNSFGIMLGIFAALVFEIVWLVPCLIVLGIALAPISGMLIDKVDKIIR